MLGNFLLWLNRLLVIALTLHLHHLHHLPDKLLVLLILLLEFVLILRVLGNELGDLKIWVQVRQVIRLGYLVLMLHCWRETKVAWVAVRCLELTLIVARCVEQICRGIQHLINVRVVS